MLGFSFTLAATRAAVPDLGGTVVGLGRAVVAAGLSLLVLGATGKLQLPERRHLPALIRVALGVVIGFPLLTAWTLCHVPASHAQIFVGLSPLATATAAALKSKERLPRRFWASALLGAVTVLLFGWVSAGGALHASDAVLLLAVACAGYGYAEGARLARELGGFRVVCWALVVSLPITLPWTLLALRGVSFAEVSTKAWVGFGYVSGVSMFLAFGAWYHGLSLGNIARNSQVQLAMPVLGVLWAALLLHEPVRVSTLLAGALVIACTLLTQRPFRSST